MFFFPVTFKGRKLRSIARKLYARCVERARDPVFYLHAGVPDSIDGRFEMIALHTGLVINRIRNEDKDGQNLAQAPFDEMFLNMEISCRQIGIGDLSVPKHIKRMMKALHGRAVHYEEAAKSGEMRIALTKNLYATAETPPDAVLDAMSDYVHKNIEMLGSVNFDRFLQGQVEFAALPEFGGVDAGKNIRVA